MLSPHHQHVRVFIKCFKQTHSLSILVLGIIALSAMTDCSRVFHSIIFTDLSLGGLFFFFLQSFACYLGIVGCDVFLACDLRLIGQSSTGSCLAEMPRKKL